MDHEIFPKNQGKIHHHSGAPLLGSLYKWSKSAGLKEGMKRKVTGGGGKCFWKKSLVPGKELLKIKTKIWRERLQGKKKGLNIRVVLSQANS